MKPVVKGLLTGCAILAVLGVGAIWWLRANKDQLLAPGKSIQTEGETFGKGVAEPRCVDEALARSIKDSGLTGTIRSTFWRNEQCSKRGFSAGHCGNVLAPVQKYCYSDVRAKKVRTRSASLSVR